MLPSVSGLIENGRLECDRVIHPYCYVRRKTISLKAPQKQHGQIENPIFLEFWIKEIKEYFFCAEKSQKKAQLLHQASILVHTALKTFLIGSL